jgi:hypothetical protein
MHKHNSIFIILKENSDEHIMCIFSGSVESVAATKILVSQVYQTQIVEQKEKGKKKRYKKPVGKPLQLVVYSNKVILDPTAHDSIAGTPGGTAMILPFPLIKGNNRVAVLDMSNYENFFDDIELLFPIPQTQSYSNSILSDAIDVVKVGSYNVSIVPNYENFIHLQFDKFNLHPDVTNLLKRYYSHNYGFMVCVLRPQARYHPFAYVHEIRNNGELFVPTRHFHGDTSAGTKFGTTMGHSVFGKFHDRTDVQGDAHADDQHDERSGLIMDDLNLKNNFYDTLMDGDEYISHQMRRTAMGGTPAKQPKKHSKRQGVQVLDATQAHPVRRGHDANDLDWDHEIYIVNRPTAFSDSILRKPGVSGFAASSGRIEQVANYIDFKRMPNDIAFGSIQSIMKLVITKTYSENHDLFV